MAAENPRRIPNQYLVRYKDGVEFDEERLAFDSTVRVLGTIPELRVIWFSASEDVIAQIRRDSMVSYVEADVAMQPLGVGDTSRATSRAALDRIDQRQLPLDNTYTWSTSGNGVHIWIVDNGVDPNHSEIVGRVSNTLSWTHDGRDPLSPCATPPGAYHGEDMAIGAAGTTAGAAYAATIHSARVDGATCEDLSSGAASVALAFITANSPRPAIANISYTRYCWLNQFCGSTMEAALEFAHDNGIFIVTGSGNEAGSACGNSPARNAKAFTMASSDPNYDVEIFGNGWGPCVDAFAPVGNNGTSYASAMAAGVAALYLQLYPTATPPQVRSWLLSNATTGALTVLPYGSPNKLLYARQPNLTGTIAGAATIGPFSSCTWYFEKQGGQPPYAVQWYRDGSPVASGDSYSVQAGEFQSFSLMALVTDGVGRTASDQHGVTFDPNDPSFICGAW